MMCVFMTAMLSACSVNAGDQGGQQETSEEDDSAKEETKSEKKNKKKNASLDKIKKAKDGEDKGENTDIYFSFLNRPCELKDGSTTLATGNYYTLELDAEMQMDYPELDSFINEYNDTGRDSLMELFAAAEEEVPEMISQGREIYDESDMYLHLLRSDDKAFSFVEEDYVFRGGAHGSTYYTGYNIDPVTGDDISFEDVVKDVDSLPDIIMKELLKQNDDLVEYFENDKAGKRDLEEGLPDRLADNAEGITWGLSYEGIEFYFEDYAMGSYAAGTRIVDVNFEDYPDVFTDNYNQYAFSDNKPAIDMVSQDAGVADTEEIVPSYFSPDEDHTGGDGDDDDFGEPVKITGDMQKKMNIFVSNFVEQGFQTYDYGHPDYRKIAQFAYMWTRINKPNDVKLDGQNYKISFEQIRTLADKYLGLKVTEDDLNDQSWDDDGSYCYYRKGYYYVPAADGECYTSFAVVDSAKNIGEGMLRLDFTAYSMDIDAFWDNDEVIPKKYYSYTSDEAAREKNIDKWGSGYAIVRSDGNSYKLNYYEIK